VEAHEVSSLVGVVLGHTATPAEAAEIAARYRRCPYCASFQSTGNSAMGIFTLPPERRWWLDRIGDNPETTMGFNYAEALFTKAIKGSSPWSRGDAKPNLSPAPCGKDCRKCACYGKQCDGCPATLDYMGA
jgi:hypothetical protein